jgi:hypothetical protein
MIKARRTLFITILCLIAGAFYISCDGGGDNNGGGDNSGQNTQTTTINGRVTNIIASAQKEERSFKFAKVLDLITFIKEAKAQGGVLVTAIIDGITVASDVTDPEGDFTLTLELDSATTVLILFDVNGEDVSIELVVEEGSILNINISIDLDAPEGDEVEIVDMEDTQGPIRCETGTVEIIANINDSVVIDGEGEACIRTEGNCTVVIDSSDILLTNCEECVDARGTSEVNIISPDGDIVCEASEDGFRARGDAEIVIDALGAIDILAGENGVKADGNSFISLGADTCVINSLESPIDVSGNAVIDTSGCGEIVEAPSTSPSPSPNPSPSPSLSPSPSPSPPPTSPPPTDPPPPLGGAIYISNCQSCHGVDGMGDPFSNVVGKSAGAISTAIMEVPAMSSLSFLSAAEINAIAVFLAP